MTLWQQGQDALRDGDAERAIGCFERSLRLEPSLTRNHLSLAAGHVARGDERAAAAHLGRYVELEPAHAAARAHYAELLLRLGRSVDARDQFERTAALPGDDAAARERLIHCHSRLMEIAAEAGDAYGQHLHRGIGLYLLAVERGRLPEEGPGPSAEALLFRAAGELSLAARVRPDEARPCWYLHAVWSRLAQSRPAARWLDAAREAAPLSYLTPAERGALLLACRAADRPPLGR
jgi:tetratricopeptide (TPR) repeat protein